MTKAVIFDLDGTLIQTEVLKATSYARAINDLTHSTVTEQQVLDVFQKFVGLSRTDVLDGLYRTFSAEFEAHLGTRDATSIKEQLIDKRLEIYRGILNDQDLLASHFCSYNLGLFDSLHSDGFTLALATMSHLPEAKKVLITMGIYEKFNLVLTRDDVQEGKPNPEIYLMTKDKLGLSAEECLIIEDSVNGIKAAKNAGIPVFAVTNDITRLSVKESGLLEDKYVVDELPMLKSRVYDHISRV